MAEHLWLALLISTLAYHCIAVDDSYIAIVGFSQSTYEAVGDTVNITVLVLNGSLMEEVNLSVVANDSGPGNISFTPSQSFSLSQSSNTFSLTVSIDLPPMEDLTFSIHLMKEEEMVMGSGDMGSGADMIMPYTVSLSPNTALVILRVAATSSRTPSPSLPAPTSSTTLSETTSPPSSTSGTSQPALTPSMSSSTVLSEATSSPLAPSTPGITSSSLPPSSSPTSLPPSAEESESDDFPLPVIVVIAVVVVLLLAIVIVVIIIVALVMVRKRRRTHTYYTAGTKFNHYIDVQLKDEEDMREKTPDSKDIQIVETSFETNANRASTTVLNEAYGTSSFKGELAKAIRVRSQGSQLDVAGAEPTSNGGSTAREE